MIMDSSDSENGKEAPVKRSFLDRFKRQKPSDKSPDAETETASAVKGKATFTQRVRSALSRTGEGIGNLFLGSKVIDEALLEELETLLLMADVGIDSTRSIIEELTSQLDRQALKDGEALRDALHEILLNKLSGSEDCIDFNIQDKPFVLFVVGVNGVGKTTTIGKLASRLKREGKSVMLAAGDTFRAAAVEQLQVWGERNQVPVIAQHTGADSASVVFDGIAAAKSRGADIIIADTAGRLHNKSNLMES